MWKKLRSKTLYRVTRARAGKDQFVCGFYDSEGEPHYFLMPKTATHSDVWQKAFELREGRPPSKLERTMVRLAGVIDANS